GKAGQRAGGGGGRRGRPAPAPPAKKTLGASPGGRYYDPAIIAQGDHMRPLHVLATLVWLTASAGLGAQSQITTGVIDGVAADTSGAVLPGVDVEIRNVDTNFTRTLNTDSGGRFVALQLPPGRYS